MASSDEEIDSIYGGEFTTPEDEIRYLKSIVTELESRNKDQTITLENITEEVRIALLLLLLINDRKFQFLT